MDKLCQQCKTRLKCLTKDIKVSCLEQAKYSTNSYKEDAIIPFMFLKERIKERTKEVDAMTRL